MMGTEAKSEFGSYAALFRRRRKWVLTIIPAVLLLSIYVAYSWPAKYRSTATVMLVQGSIPQEFIKATVNASADAEIETIQGRALTLDALRGLVRQFDPYPDEPTWNTDRKAQEVISDTGMERVDPVTFEVLQKSPAFSLHYDNPDPHRAAVVAKLLSDLFLTYHQRERVEAAKAAETLIHNQSTGLEKELQQVDREYAQLRAAHGGTLPDNPERSEDRQYRAELDLENLEQGLRTAQEKESLLAIQLASTSPHLLSSQALANAQGARNPALPEGLTDLATVKALLADAEVRYTPDHPDVKRLKRALAVLEARKQQAGAKAVEADNPEYRRISSELAAARADIAARQNEIARARARLQRYNANLNPSVGLAQQISELERRRTTLQAQFQDVQGKLKSAQQGQVVEADPHAEHFTLLRAPTAATTPYSPNRLGVILLGLVLGCGIAALVVWVVESADDTVRGVRDVAALGSIPLLGSISEIRLPSEVRRGRLIWGSVSALYVLAAIFVTVAVIQAQVHQDLVQKSSTMNRASQ
jgi:succinoglycan biosynthesis transport protein ExoP